MNHQSNMHERMEYISADVNTFLLKTWTPLSVTIVWMVGFTASWINSDNWNLKSVGHIVVLITTATSLYYLIRYFVSGFADEVWMDDENILFKKDGKSVKSSLNNVEEIKSFYFAYMVPFNSKQYLVRIKFSESNELGKQIRFFVRGPRFNQKSDKAVIEILVERIINAQRNQSNQAAKEPQTKAE